MSDEQRADVVVAEAAPLPCDLVEATMIAGAELEQMADDVQATTATAIEQAELFGAPTVVARVVDRDALTRAITGRLRNLSLEEFVGLFTDEVTEMIAYVNLSAGEDGCRNTSLLFNPHRLDTRGNKAPGSVFEGLKDDSFCSGLARALLWRNGTTNSLLAHTLGVGVNAYYLPGEFPPAAARDLALEYHLTAASRVLDPCAGWGGRMIGLSCVVDNYTACEPSTKTYNGLDKLAEWIRMFRPNFKANLHHLPYEDFDEEGDLYDFALTSPPYFDTELYSDEPTNSCNRYASGFDAWCDGFFLPMIDATMRRLKPSAAFILNIGSRKYPLNQVLRDNYEALFSIKRLSKQYILQSTGLGRGTEAEGEVFYEVRHRDWESA